MMALATYLSRQIQDAERSKDSTSARAGEDVCERDECDLDSPHPLAGHNCSPQMTQPSRGDARCAHQRPQRSRWLDHFPRHPHGSASCVHKK